MVVGSEGDIQLCSRVPKLMTHWGPPVGDLLDTPLSNMCAKQFSNSNFNLQLLPKYQFFKKLPQNSHNHKNCNFFKYNCNFLDQLLLPYKFHRSSMTGILFSNFASSELLSYKNSLFPKGALCTKLHVPTQVLGWYMYIVWCFSIQALLSKWPQCDCRIIVTTHHGTSIYGTSSLAFLFKSSISLKC